VKKGERVSADAIRSPLEHLISGLRKFACALLLVALYGVSSALPIGAATHTAPGVHDAAAKPIGRGKDSDVVLTGFTPTLGATRSEVESLFHSIDGSHTTFATASKVKGVPRALGGDKRLFTIIEINGFPQVVDVQMVTIFDTASKSVLEQQVSYDSLSCRDFATEAAQKWCTGRVLNTNANGLVTATETKTFAGLRITVRTYRSSNASDDPVVSMDFSAT
jgi:hypothetical protein